MNLNPQYLLSRLLECCGVKDYLSRVEFAAHVGWSIAISAIGILLWKPLISLWILYSIWDEMLCDGYKGGDTLCDLLTKCLIPALTLWGSLILGPLAFV